jgi:hypothetical protein
MGAADKVVNELAGAGRALLRDVEEGLLPPVEPRDRTAVHNLPTPPAGAARDEPETGS